MSCSYLGLIGEVVKVEGDAGAGSPGELHPLSLWIAALCRAPWRASERKIKFATVAAPYKVADHLNHLLQHRHQVLFDVLADRRDNKHLQPDMEVMFDNVKLYWTIIRDNMLKHQL